MDNNGNTIGQEIDMIEKKYNISFPKELKMFYLENDCTTFKAFSFFVGNYECGFAKMIPIISEGLSFEKIVDGDRSDGFIPESYFPIARDRGGNLYYWDDHTGKVYFVLNDDIENPFLVFSKVSDFLNCIKSHQ